MRVLNWAVLAPPAIAVVMAAPAYAADEVQYAQTPDWVQQADVATLAKQSGPAELLREWQHRIEGGTVYSYVDRAVRIENPQALVEEGTVGLAWLPDKGDLTIHRLEILRGGETIDLVAGGTRFDVIRREQGLEKRLVDGELTATVFVPGLQVGDILHASYSTSLNDQALGERVQVTQYLPTAPWQVQQSRAIVSWPEGAEIQWDAEAHANIGAPELRGGYNYLSVDLPLARAEEMPGDAPWRFQRPNVLRVGSFADWADLSRAMAPHFLDAANVAPGSAVAQQAARIMAQTADPLDRTVLAVRLVQDEISYLLNGLDGGNYLPQRAEETWDKRYGDCKAKSVLLLALLNEMGVEAEVVLVASGGGDALPELLPLPASFDHMIVHARIDGVDYWLDGTSTATRRANISDVPPFYYALPLSLEGRELVPMVQRDLAAPQSVAQLQLDQSAGVDFPMLFTMNFSFTGPSGAPMRAMADTNDPESMRLMAQSFVANLPGGQATSIKVNYDDALAEARITITGVAHSGFDWNDGKLSMAIDAGNDYTGFNPDRARRAWRQIPVVTNGPGRTQFSSRTILPDGGAGYSLAGEPNISGGFGNLRVTTAAQIDSGALLINSETFAGLGEITAADLPAAKRAATHLGNTKGELVVPENAHWRWELNARERAARSAPIIAAYDKAIEFADRDDFGPLMERAVFRTHIFDFEAALADFNTLVERSPSAWAYVSRSALLANLNRNADAIADLREAYDLEPNNGTAFSLAQLLAYEGQNADALALLDSLPVGDEDSTSYADALATVSGLGGDPQMGLLTLEDEVIAKPQNSAALNSDCWFRGLFNVGLDNALASCTRAVERAEFSAAALDSRALVRYRLGDLAEAVADLNAALEVAPGQAPSMYLRGIIRLEQGDRGGRSDIDNALGMSPQLAKYYARHGLEPGR